MSFDPSAYIPEPRTWFSTQISYEGWGRAEFLRPKGWLEGKTTIYFDELGNAKIQMSRSHYKNESNPDGRFALWELLSGHTQQEQPNQEQFSIDIFAQEKNQCSRFEVETGLGKFLILGIVSYFFFPASEVIQFSCSASQFIVQPDELPTYWVLPLSNFVSDFGYFYGGFNDHPLRLFNIPNVPLGLSESEAVIASMNARIRNQLAVFEFNGSTGFIERVSNYNEKKEGLEKGQYDYAITAVMVGEVNGKSTQPEDLMSWLPIRFLEILSLATGVRVSSPWIELRDEKGNLCSRLHIKQWQKAYSSGHTPIWDHIHHGLGQLLTQAQSSPNFENKGVFAAINQLILGMQTGISPEDRMAHLFRGLDALCEAENLYSLPSNTLDQNWVEQIKKIISEASKRIREIAKDAEAASQINDARIIRDVIAQRVSGALDLSNRIKYYAAIRALLTKYGLPDAEIMDKYYATNPRQDGREWVEILSIYRGIVIHENYFRFYDGTHDLQDAAQITRHICDLLLRLVFKCLNYDGKYQPPIATFLSDNYTVDWVQPNTSAQALGYK
jgi:hypothetical protein